MPFKPSASHLDVMRYLRDDASPLSRDNILLHWLAEESDRKRKLEAMIEEYVDAASIVRAVQLIREFGPLPMGKAKRR